MFSFKESYDQHIFIRIYKGDISAATILVDFLKKSNTNQLTLMFDEMDKKYLNIKVDRYIFLIN